MQLTRLTAQCYDVNQSVHEQFIVRIFHRRAIERRQDHVQNFATYTLVNAQIESLYVRLYDDVYVLYCKFLIFT